MINLIKFSTDIVNNITNEYIVMGFRSDFDEFVKLNGLSQKSLAETLNVSEAFISRLSTGMSKCPADKLETLERLAKEKDWDMSMFHRIQQANDNAIINNNQGGVVNNIGTAQGNKETTNISSSEVFATLLKQLEKKDAQIESLISRLIDITERLIALQK